MPELRGAQAPGEQRVGAEGHDHRAVVSGAQRQKTPPRSGQLFGAAFGLAGSPNHALQV